MNDQTFVDSILASPDDHTRWLVYADWLDERGDPRGELLRVVHEMRSAPACSAQYRKLRRRREVLREDCDKGWLKEILRLSLPEIRKRLEELDRTDVDREVFASDSHQYRLNPPLTPQQLDQVESRIGSRLPEQYRHFVIEFADGGAGPDYGIDSLLPLLDSKNDEYIPPLLEPFPAPANAEEMRSMGYTAPGALSVCQIGCGGYYHLILTGPERGHVWIQNPDADWSPALLDESQFGDEVDIFDVAIQSPDELKLEFIDWYVKWIDDALWTVSNRYTDVVQMFDVDDDTTDITIAKRDITTLPERLRKVRGLIRLNLHGNKLTAIPEWIGAFEELEFLGLTFNPLRSLPESIGNLRHLRQLSCSYTDALKYLPPTIGQLAKVEVLDLNNNRLTHLPNGIGCLANLRQLNLGHNNLAELPDEFGELAQLRELDLRENKLRKLPASFAKLAELEELELQNNQLRALPSPIAALPRLRKLSLGENSRLKLADACRELAQISTLRHLSLFMCSLTELPDEIGMLTQLTSLDVSWNKLDHLPSALAQLTNLERLSLDFNSDMDALISQQQALLPHLG